MNKSSPLYCRSMILVCGFPRSGTTWLSKILDSVSDTFLISEPDKRANRSIRFGKLPHFVRVGNQVHAEAYRQAMAEAMGRIAFNLSQFPFFKKNFIRVPYWFYWASHLSGQVLNYCFNPDQRRVFGLPDKFLTPGSGVDLLWKSVNQSSNLPFLHAVFPNLKIIYILRNPFSVMSSGMNHYRMVSDGQNYRRLKERAGSDFFKGREILLEEARTWNELELKALLWQVECENAFNFGKTCTNFKLLFYEKMVDDPIGTARDIFDWLNWSMEPQTLDFLAASTGQQRPHWINRLVSSSYFGVYRPSGGDTTQWKKRLTIREYESIFSVLQSSALLSFWPQEALTL